MDIKQFTFPPEGYPRYRYAREHVTRLLKRARLLIEKCAINDPSPMAKCLEVNIYIIFDKEPDIISINELTNTDCKCIENKVLHSVRPDEFKTIVNGQYFVCVSSFKNALKTDTLIWQYIGQAVLFVHNETDSPCIPDAARNFDNLIVSVKQRSCVAAEIDMMLERMVFKQLYSRVKILQSFLNLKPAHVVFASVNQSIEHALSEKLRMTFERFDVTRLYKAWHEARLEVIKGKINEAYDKDDKHIKTLILKPPRTSPFAVNIRPLTIVEHILPFVDNSTPSKHGPGLLLAKINDMNTATDVQRMADTISTKFLLNLNCVSDNKDHIEQLYWECIAMYNRSGVPEHERPTPLQQISLRLEHSIAKKILKVNGVVGCGYRFTILDIFLTDLQTATDRKRSEDQIKTICSSNNIDRYKIRAEHANRLLSYTVGSVISGNYGQRASLGGFAKRGHKQKLCLLLARHFACHGPQIFVESDNGNKELIAHVLPIRFPEDCNLDISVADVLHNTEEKCSTQFKDQNGNAMNSRLMRFDDKDSEWLHGLPVHIWGAGSSPGLGTIIIPDYLSLTGNGDDNLTSFVKIEDRDDYMHFAREGDSGAIVCANDISGEFVHVISMLMGSLHSQYSEQKHNYISFRLVDGISQLTKEYGEEFQLC